MNSYTLKAILVLLLAFCFLTETNAQKKRREKKPTSEEQKTLDTGTKKSRVIVFDDEEGEEGDEGESTKKTMILKTNPMSFILGTAFLELEKEISPTFSIQGGVGVTFEENTKKIFGLFNDEAFDFSSYLYDSPFWGSYDIQDELTEGRKNKIGYMFTISPKLYIESDGFEGSYFAPAFHYKIFNKNVGKAIGEPFGQVQYSSTEFDTEVVTYKELVMRYGYQTLFSKAATESFLGLGYRWRTASVQDAGYNADGTIGTTFTNLTSKDFVFEFGIRIGFQL